MSKSEWARRAGIGQTTFWTWTRGPTTETSGERVQSGVEFVRLNPGAVGAVLDMARADARIETLQGEMTFDNGELRVVARRGTLWSDVERMVALLRSAK
jgi:hypothetical protein